MVCSYSNSDPNHHRSPPRSWCPALPCLPESLPSVVRLGVGYSRPLLAPLSASEQPISWLPLPLDYLVAVDSCFEGDCRLCEGFCFPSSLGTGEMRKKLHGPHSVRESRRVILVDCVHCCPAVSLMLEYRSQRGKRVGGKRHSPLNGGRLRRRLAY